jgi:D-3-phosphoglycerate dehydrogenase
MSAVQRLVIIDTGYGGFSYEAEAAARLGATLEVFSGDRHDRDGKIAFARGADGVFVRWTEIDGPFLDALPSVKAVVRYGVGYDNIDVAAATARGVRASNVPGYANHSVSDHALALLLACHRALKAGITGLRSHYNQPPRMDIPELHTMTLGIVGLGRIGGTLSRRGGGLFRRVLACDPYIDAARFEETGAEQAELDTVLRESDAISLHCNLTSETTRLIDAAAIAKMERRPILVNTARGPVVDEEALYEGVQTGAVRAAGLDVYWDEPPLANRDALLNHPQVIATGHYAWYSDRAGDELQRRAAETMVQLLTGQKPEGLLTPV